VPQRRRSTGPQRDRGNREGEMKHLERDISRNKTQGGGKGVAGKEIVLLNFRWGPTNSLPSSQDGRGRGWRGTQITLEGRFLAPKLLTLVGKNLVTVPWL